MPFVVVDVFAFAVTIGTVTGFGIIATTLHQQQPTAVQEESLTSLAYMRIRAG